MNIPLNISMIDNPALWRLSMMFSADGLDVVLRKIVGEGRMVASHIDIDGGAMPAAASFEEAVYSNPLLLQPFRKTDLMVDGGFTLIVPKECDSTDIDSLFPPANESITLTADFDSRNEVLFRLDRGVYNFVRRSFDSANVCHSLGVLGNFFLRQSRVGNTGKMFIDINRQSMNVLVFNRFGTALANSFRCADINDAAYYALASADTAGFDFSNDEIRIAGDSERRAAIMPILRRFASHVMPAVFPSAVYGDDSSSLSVPFPLIILPLCE